MLFIHLGIALTSVLATAYAFVSPTQARLRGSYILVGLTILSGTYLVLATHSPMLQSCITGLAYIGFMLGAIAVARRRLVADKAPKKRSKS